MSIQRQMALASEDSDIHQLEAELRLKNGQASEFKLFATTYGHLLLEEAGLPRKECFSLASENYTIRTQGKTMTELLPEHARRVVEARRQIQYDYREMLGIDYNTDIPF